MVSSANENRTGTASGINNAVARLASVLSVAVVGILMVKIFSSDLERSFRGQALPASVLQYVHANAIKLAGLELPAGLDTHTSAMIRASISQAFVSGFRIEMLICAALSVAGGAVAWLMVPGKN